MSRYQAISPFQERQDTVLQTLLRTAELAACIERHAPQEGVFHTAVPRLTLVRAHRGDEPVHAVHEPCLCMLAQGRKRLLLGDEVFVYEPSTYLLVSQHLPVSGQVVDASAERPYLALKLAYDTKELSSLMLRMGISGVASRQTTSRGVVTADVQPDLLDAMLRLVRLLDSPEDIDVLAPLVTREVLYRLLTGPSGTQLAQLSLTDSASHRVSKAIDWLRAHYNEPLDSQRLAALAHLSESALRTHFKAATAMSPLQYQKKMRLQEARRMLITERLDAATAAHRVGYESASQFSREYGRMFGAPPARDVKRFRQNNGEQARAVAGEGTPALLTTFRMP